MKKVFIVFVVVLVISVLMVGCGEMVDTGATDSANQYGGEDEERLETAADHKTNPSSSQESMWNSEADYVTGPTGKGYKVVEPRRPKTDPPSIGEIILAPPEFDYKTMLSPSLGMSLEEFLYGLIYADNNTVESQQKTVDPPSIGEIILGPTGTGYRSVDEP